MASLTDALTAGAFSQSTLCNSSGYHRKLAAFEKINCIHLSSRMAVSCFRILESMEDYPLATLTRSNLFASRIAMVYCPSSKQLYCYCLSDVP